MKNFTLIFFTLIFFFAIPLLAMQHYDQQATRALIEAARKNNADGAREALNKGACPNGERTFHGHDNEPLHAAIEHDNDEIYELLHRYGGNFTWMIGSPEWDAAFEGSVKICRALLDHGGDIEDVKAGLKHAQDMKVAKPTHNKIAELIAMLQLTNIEYNGNATMDLRNATHDNDIPEALSALQNGANPHHAILYAARHQKADIIALLYTHGARLPAFQLFHVKNVPLIAGLLKARYLDMQELDNAFFEYQEDLRTQHAKIDYNFCNKIQKLISYPKKEKNK